MTTTPAVLIAAKQAEIAQTTQYTSDASGKGTWLDKFTATNTSGSTASVSVNIVTISDTAGNQNLIVKTKSLAAGETYAFPELSATFLDPGGFISTIASAATSITIRANGRKIT